jgi:hypothetical protein
MRLFPIASLAATCALAAGAVIAQASPPHPAAGPASETADPSAAAPATAASQAATPASATIGGAGGVASSPTPPDEAFRLKAGDPTVVSNNPIPDTPANRQLYGGPTSRAGRHSAASGD